MVTQLLAVVLLALSTPALAGGFSVRSAYTSSYGPDAYGLVHVGAQAGPDLEVGALWVGGNQPALLASAARTLRLHDLLVVRGELLLGMLRREGPSGGFELGARLDAHALTVVVEGGLLAGLGSFAEAGVDTTLAEGWVFQPRLRVETWAGDRDPALRVGLGLRRETASGWWVEVAGSAGGRDVLHMGPGLVLALGRSR